jgi:hypothetical protein
VRALQAILLKISILKFTHFLSINFFSMTTRILSLIAFVVCTSVPALFAQDATPYVPTPRTAVNTIYAELLGNAGTYSLNYERMIQDNIGLRIGASYFGLSVQSPSKDSTISTSSFSLPLMGMYFVGTEASRLELGLGVTVSSASGKVTSVTNGETSAGGLGAIITSTIAYRLQPPQGGFNFKIGATPFFSPATGTFQLWGGISAGFGF